MIENEIKTSKCFFYEYDKENRTIVYVRPRYHIPSTSDPDEVKII